MLSHCVGLEYACSFHTIVYTFVSEFHTHAIRVFLRLGGIEARPKACKGRLRFLLIVLGHTVLGRLG